MGRKVTQDEVEKWVALKERGYTDTSIAEKFNRNEKTIAKYLRPYLEGKRGQGSPQDAQDSELEMLEMEKKRHQVLMELETVKQAMMKIPERLDKLETTLKAIGEDLESLRLRLNSQPDFSKLKCPKCGDYMAVDAMCVSCNHKYCFGLWPGGE